MDLSSITIATTTPVYFCFVCLFVFFCFVLTFHLGIVHMDQRHWGWWWWWSHRGRKEWKMVRDNEEKCSLCQQWPSHLFRIFHSMFVFFFFGHFLYIYMHYIFSVLWFKDFLLVFFFCVLSSTIHTEMTGSNPMMNIHLWYYSVSHRGATQKLFETVQK